MKYNIAAFFGFLIGSVIYVIVFPTFEEWTWAVASIAGGLLEFPLLSLINKTKTGNIFDT